MGAGMGFWWKVISTRKARYPFRSLDASLVDPPLIIDRPKRIRLPGPANGINPKVAGLGVVGRPNMHFRWLHAPDLDLHHTRGWGFPLELWQRQIMHHTGITSHQGLVSIGFLRLCSPLERNAGAWAPAVHSVKSPGVWQEKLISCGVDDVFGHRQAIPILEGLDDFHEVLIRLGILPFHDALGFVVTHSGGIKPVGSKVMLEGRHHIEHVDHNGEDAPHPLVHRSGRPCGPSTLGTACHHKLPDRDLPPSSLAHMAVMVSMAHGRLGHG